VVVGEERRRPRVGLVRGADAVQEPGADDAAAAPDRGHRARVDAPVVLGAARLDLVEALRVGDDLGGVQGLLHRVGEAGADDGGAGRARQPLRRLPQRGVPGDRPGEHRLGDAADRDAQVEGRLHGPAAGALLLGLVQDDVHERPAGGGVGVRQHLGGDLDQVRLQPPGVPGAEHLRDLRRGQSGGMAQQVVGLGDQLHVGVLDAVVHHLHEVPGAVGADVHAAGRPVDLGGDVLQQRAERRVGLRRPARHDAGAVQRALLAAGDAGADEVQPALAQRGLAAPGVGVVRVAPVDDHVAGLQQRRELVDDRVGGRSRLHHDHQPPRAFQRGHELLGRLGRQEGPLVPELLHQRLGARGGPVVQGHRMAVPREVPGEVAPHDRQPRDADPRAALFRVTHWPLLPSRSSRALPPLVRGGTQPRSGNSAPHVLVPRGNGIHG
jgi:hypothetical protein